MKPEEKGEVQNLFCECHHCEYSALTFFFQNKYYELAEPVEMFQGDINLGKGTQALPWSTTLP